ncbi:MAG: hypothetical protein H7123_10120 [Thermoleophilia bacterium]|nr:hypothetical protein [Thermoleophilia bacterium]
MGRNTHILIAAVLLSIIASAAGIGVSRATFTVQTTNPANLLTGFTLPTPAIPTHSTATACLMIAVSWTAVTGATAYRVEGRTGNGGWTVLTASTGSLTYNDATGYMNRSVFHRVTALISGTTWESTPAISTELTCGIGEVVDLAISNPCSKEAMTWSAPVGANNYDVAYSTTGGAPWTPLVTDQATVNYSDIVQHVGANVTYQLTPGNGATNGTAVTMLQTAWNDFSVSNVTFANSGTVATRNAGDTITVTFSKPALTPISGTNLNLTSVVTTRRIIYLAASSNTAATTQIGLITEGTNTFVNATIINTGTTTLSADGLTWTWTSLAGTANSMSQALTGTWSVGTQANFAKCAVDSTTLRATTPTISGTW